jgi:hypothetical protein
MPAFVSLISAQMDDVELHWHIERLLAPRLLSKPQRTTCEKSQYLNTKILLVKPSAVLKVAPVYVPRG